MPNSVHHLAVEVSDAERSAEFYCSLLGFTRGDRFDFPDRGRVIIFVSLGEVRLEFLQGPPGPSDQGRAPLRCSFCGREKPRQISELIAGPDVYICV
ncbi:MAG: VOC family protein, partial [Armatimonadetes bacterium]|nr:VOC family protein [Armatimonadota bacterium]